MERTNITSVWVEIQVDADGIGLSLISEGDSGAVVENIEHFTFEELQSMDGHIQSMNLSDNARDTLSEQAEDATVGNLLQSENLSEAAEEMPTNPSSKELLAYMDLLGGGATDGEPTGEDPDGTVDTGVLPTAGDVLTDVNAPSWSDDDWVEVVEVLDAQADEYVIQGRNEGKVIPRAEQDWTDETVADANPSYDSDETVVIGQYSGTGKHYAFPVSRLA